MTSTFTRYKMKFRVIISTLLLSIIFLNPLRAQIYQHFIFIEGKPFVYDVPNQQLAEKAIGFYYQGINDSAIFYYKKLIEQKPNYYQAYFNIAKIYARQKDYLNVEKSLIKYVQYAKENCSCSFLNETEEFKTFSDSTSLALIKKDCCANHEKYVSDNKLAKPDLLLALQFIEGKEQEILGNNIANREELLKANFSEFNRIVDTTFLPGHSDIGKGTALVELIVLHTDYYPEIQNSLGKKILISAETKGYNPKMAAYIIDRSLRNMNKPQLYGTILIQNEKGESISYQYDNYDALVKRRKELGFQSLEDFLKNKSITK
jgi:hypothetical protein